MSVNNNVDVINIMEIIERVENFAREYDLFKAHDKLLIACSGGPDSMALVDIFQKLSVKYKLEIIVAHAEHGIRKESSLNDAWYVKNYCEQKNIPFFMEHLNVLEHLKIEKLSVETLARKLRYQFLRKIAKAQNATKIVTAHHLNDQAETVLQHLLRGAGTAGLSGMKAKNEDIIRPFLCLYREEIEAYCLAENINPCLDETNNCLDYERNRIRLDLIPRLKAYNPKVVTAICNSAKIIAQENDFINYYVKNFYRDKVIVDIDNQGRKSIKIDIKVLKQEHKAIRNALYRYTIKEFKRNLENISFIHIDKIDKFLYNGHTGLILQLPKNLQVKINYDRLTFSEKEILPIENSEEKEQNISIKIDLGLLLTKKEIKLPYEQSLIIDKICGQDEVMQLFGREHCFVDMDKIKGDLFIRKRQNGDRITPKGMTGSKKVKDILIDRKIPAEDRDKIPLVCDEKGIIWIAGIQQDNNYLVNKNSKHILYLKLKK